MCIIVKFNEMQMRQFNWNILNFSYAWICTNAHTERETHSLHANESFEEEKRTAAKLVFAKKAIEGERGRRAKERQIRKQKEHATEIKRVGTLEMNSRNIK